ncbi:MULTISPECIES: class I SAM-dependent methyltransferase [unclassified Enterococcus]|uniref:class I SAM-dependent methyltransferase n=1 Tax=unclassified Enterococcus TaxID=2608891 RepID=UPI0015541EAE|nr:MULTISPECIES: class I SAM-dependent methyltransferase [unclassified Enterococcus]MBS7578110.1 SAM-dependent methyltransferase [Enterococcus sp. MMGLQ5-2]MBS7585370.1 SAM-dependent methyltransferase [Enterococcus sp. MMGLQ5-1]NPD13227.1 SAM-dependent methyltransferase [Enterococcus sp. MMGLQ5-1]NPD37941.1 SAM-dependent methyltransferase [Enterococcus sp. MMGLQ5-2]
MQRPLNQGHLWLKEVIKAGDSVIDATMGNGNDTCFLAKLGAAVTAFDIQEVALIKTKQRLEEANLSANLILDGHQNIYKYIQRPIKAAIFNLGYLPSSDKSIITLAETTISALKQCLSLLEVNGRIAIMIYYGHAGGQSEKNAVIEFVSQLPQENYQVYQYTALNQINQPPFLVILEKKK